MDNSFRAKYIRHGKDYFLSFLAAFAVGCVVGSFFPTTENFYLVALVTLLSFFMLKNQIRIADSSRNTLISAVLLCCASAACRIHAVSLSFILCVAWHCTISFSTGACKLSAECACNAPHQYWHTSLGYRSLLDSILSDCSATRENVYIRML